MIPMPCAEDMETLVDTSRSHFDPLNIRTEVSIPAHMVAGVEVLHVPYLVGKLYSPHFVCSPGLERGTPQHSGKSCKKQSLFRNSTH